MTQPQEDLVCEFLAVFARFEQALKAAGFHYGDGDARANWISFAEHPRVEAEISGTGSSLTEEVNLFLQSPPRKQVIDDGNLAWSDTPASQDTDSKRVVVYLKRVRNNLFHGGKFAEGGYLRDRDIRLIQASKQILMRCVNLNTDVGDHFRHMENAG